MPTNVHIPSGYRIVAIISPCQGEDTGSIPVTRSITKLPHAKNSNRITIAKIC